MKVLTVLILTVFLTGVNSTPVPSNLEPQVIVTVSTSVGVS